MTTTPGRRKREHPEAIEEENLTFFCRFLFHPGYGSKIEPIESQGMRIRGTIYSECMFAYQSAGWENDDDGDKKVSDGFSVAAMRLHVSVLPDDLPCRSDETDKITKYLRDAIKRKGENKPLYISGMPGTGKTACVMSCVKKLRAEALKGKLENFDFVMVNGLQLQNPADAYSVILRKMSGVKCGFQAALSKLQAYFKDSDTENQERESVICLVDELDFLMLRNDNVIYNLFDWPLRRNSGLIIVGIANTMDLPERMSTRVLSRLQSGIGMERMVFAPYSFDQVLEILKTRLRDSDVFEKKSLEMSARIAASTAGDLRTALKICQRSIELHRDGLNQDLRQSTEKKVSYASVQLSVKEYRATPLLSALVHSCQLDKAIIVSMCKHYATTGLFGMSSSEIYDRLEDIKKQIMSTANTSLKGLLFAMPSIGVLNERLNSLCSRGLLSKTFAKSIGIQSLRMIYSIVCGIADVSAALRDDKFGQLLSGDTHK
jgi:Cdc6-like AAA superfamily ATPase